MKDRVVVGMVCATALLCVWMACRSRRYERFRTGVMDRATGCVYDPSTKRVYPWGER